MLDVEIIEDNKETPLTEIRKRLISNDIQKINPEFKQIVSFFMKADKNSYLDNKLLLVHLLNSTIERAYIEGQQAGTKHIEYIKGGDDGIKPEQVYRKRSDNYVGD